MKKKNRGMSIDAVLLHGVPEAHLPAEFRQELMFITTRFVGSLAEGVFLLGQIAQEWNEYTEGKWNIRYDTDSWNHQIICNRVGGDWFNKECVVLAQLQEQLNNGPLRKLQPWHVTRKESI
jgi:hypothetical protein